MVRKCIALGSALALAISVAACGSSSNPAASASSASSNSSASASSSAAKGPSIKLGFVCSCSGPQANALSSLKSVMQAWASSVDASGGINGHPVQLFAADDGSNPAASLQAVKGFVEQDHVIAIVGDSSLADSAWASYVAAKGIPVVGGISPEPPFQTSPDFYPSGAQLVLQTIGSLTLAKEAGKSHVGVTYCAESPVCAQLVPLVNGGAKMVGLKVTVQKVSSTAPTYVPQCLAFKSAGADALFIGANAATVEKFASNCAQQGYTPQQVTEANTVASSWTSVSSLNNALISGSDANPFDTSLPAVAQFRAALQKYAPNTLQQFSEDTIYPWAGGLLFQAAAKAAKLSPTSTPADVKKGLYALKAETLGGIAPPLTFAPGKPAFVPCYFSQQLKGGKFVSLNGGKPTCLTAAQSAALAKALHL